MHCGGWALTRAKMTHMVDVTRPMAQRPRWKEADVRCWMAL